MLMSNGMIEKTGKTLDVISHYLKKEKIIGFGPMYDINTWKRITYDNFQQGLTFISVERLNKTELIEDRNLLVRIILGNKISKQIKNAYIGFHIHSSDKTIASGVSKIGDVKDTSSFDLAINLDNIVDGEFYKSDWEFGTFSNGRFYYSNFYDGYITNGVLGNNGTANPGGGAGGSTYVYLGGEGPGSTGGKGVVILSVPTANYSSTTTGSPTVTTSGSNTILQFNGSGSYTA
jgi:hypothetical protein